MFYLHPRSKINEITAKHNLMIITKVYPVEEESETSNSLNYEQIVMYEQNTIKSVKLLYAKKGRKALSITFKKI